MPTPQQLRGELVNTLVARGYATDARVIEALAAVPRHLFLPNTPVEEAYDDRAIVTQVANGTPTSSASQPAVVAMMLEQLRIEPGHRILEIGTGTGWNAALLAHLAGPSGSVTSVEIDPGLAAGAREHLSAAAIAGVAVQTGDGRDGWRPDAPYDRIMVTAAANAIPDAWREQLRFGGRLVVPITIPGAAAGLVFERTPEYLAAVAAFPCVFIPLR